MPERIYRRTHAATEGILQHEKKVNGLLIANSTIPFLKVMVW